MADAVTDDRIDKRRVTMTNVVAVPGGTSEQVATDYVNPELLDAYLVDARTRWQLVEVSDEPDAGPGGYGGQTSVPAHLPVPDAGTVRPAEKD